MRRAYRPQVRNSLFFGQVGKWLKRADRNSVS